MLNQLRIRLGAWKQSFYERWLWYRAGSPLRAARLFDAPPVIYLFHHRGTWPAQLKALRGKFGGDVPGLLLLGHLWLQDAALVAELGGVANFAKRVLPGWTLVSLCNSLEEQALYRDCPMESAFINQNAFIDERIFTIFPNAGKKYDAVYDGQLVSFKRHLLAAKIPKLALISYRYAMNYRGGYGRQVRDGLPHATWINDPSAPDYQMLSASEVAKYLNEAQVGLCLSDEEGAMYASIQYLLCGLPVVSTPSRGGRDVFFDPKDCLIVEANPASVAAGVQKMIDRKLSPAEVRERALARIWRHRAFFIERVQRHLDSVGVAADFAEIYQKRFENKWVLPRRIEEL